MDNQQYQSFSQKDEFSSRLDKALNEYASLQNAFASYKGNSSSRPQTPQMNLMSPNDSRLISNNPKIMNTPSTVNIIKEFRNVFQEAENTLKVNNGNNQSESFFYQMPQRESNLNESNFTNTNVAAVTGNNNNVDNLKISNEILNKSNLDLKNLNKLLKIELSSYKNSIGSTGNIPLTQYDTNISIYIDTLKTALNTAQMSGRELNEIYNQVKEQNDKIVEENENLKNQVMQFSKENEETSSTKKDYETLNTNLLQKCNELSNENMQIQSEIEDIQNQILNQKEKNETLQSLIDNFSKSDVQTKEILKNLRAAIDELKMKNDEGLKANDQINEQVAQFNGEIENKNSEISVYNQKIDFLKEEIEKAKENNRLLLEKSKEKDNALSQKNFSIKKIISDTEILKSNTATLLKCINDKNKTIENLKESLNVLQGTETYNSGANDSKRDELIQKRKQLVDILSETSEISSQIDETKKKYSEMIVMKDQKIKVLSK